MSIIARDTGGGDFEPIPAGMHNAVGARIYDLGNQPGFNPGSFAHKVVVLWELATRYTTGDYKDQRMRVSKTYTLSLSEKANLRHDLESWRGRAFTEAELQGFDVEKVIGAPCTLNLVETLNPKTQKRYVKVAAVMPLMSGAERLSVETPADFTPEWVSRLLSASQPVEAYTVPTEGAGTSDEAIPF
jgi:hypothetical protein